MEIAPPALPGPPPVPGWVKAFGFLALALAVVLAVVVFVQGDLGNHGPGRHRP